MAQHKNKSTKIWNINKQEQRKRLIVAISFGVVSVGLLVMLIAIQTSIWVRATLFLPLFFGTMGLLQAKEAT